MSLVYWLSKFSHEAMLLELFLIACVTACYFGYLLLQKRRYGVARKTIPDHIVRAYLMEMISQAEGFKNQLFGEEFKIAAGQGLKLEAQLLGGGAGATAAAGAAAGDAKDVGALKNQLAATSAKADEFAKAVAALKAEKSALEAKLAAGGGAGAAAGGGGGDNKDLLDKIAKLESKLAEYEVIEDDLANLKRYQQENKQLKAQLDALKGGAPAVAAAAPAPEPVAVAAAPAAAPEPTPEPVASEPIAAEPPAAEPVAEPVAEPTPEPVAAAEASPIAAAEETVSATKEAEKFETLVDKVEESLATPVGASAVDPAVVAEATTTAPVVEAAPAAAAGEAPKTEKSDADLLNEFERMLSS